MARLVAHGYPEGTVVQAFPREALVNGGSPSGSPASSATVTNGALDFTGLTAGRRYVAWALNRDVQFLAEPGSVDQLRPISGSDAQEIRQALQAEAIDISKPFDIFSAPAVGGDAAAAIQTALSQGKNVFVGDAYTCTGFTFPVRSDGGQAVFGLGPSISKLTYTGGSGRMITFGDGGATDTRFQKVIGLQLIGNSTGLSAVYYNKTRWCDVTDCDIRGWTNASAHAVDFNGGVPNYYYVITRVQFGEVSNRSDIRCLSTGAEGANSGRIYDCHFSSTGANCDQNILVDGGDTVRIYDNEFPGNPSGAGGAGCSIRAIGTTLNLRIKDNQFDGPVKAWDLGAGVTNAVLRDNTGSGTALLNVVDAGTNNYRDDVVTRGCRWSVYHSANQSIPNNTTQPLTTAGGKAFNTEEYDPQNLHTGGTVTITVPGLYLLVLDMQFAANATGKRQARIRLTRSGSTTTVLDIQADPPADGTSPCFLLGSREVPLLKDDVLVVEVFQNSGVALNLVGGNTPGSVFQGRRVG